MNERTMEILIERLERLERQNTRFKRTGILALFVISAFALLGQSLPINQEVRAQKFSLRDARGKSRAMLYSPPDGQVFLVLSDKDGEPRVTLAVAADGTPALGLADKGDKFRVELSISKDSPRLSLYSKEGGKPRAILDLDSDGSPRLGFMDKNQSPRIVVGASGKEWGVGVFDSKGKLLGGLGETK